MKLLTSLKEFDKFNIEIGGIRKWNKNILHNVFMTLSENVRKTSLHFKKMSGNFQRY